MSPLARAAPRDIRIISIPNGVVVAGLGFYQSMVVTHPGIILALYSGTLPLETVKPGLEFIEAEAKRSGPVAIINDLELVAGHTPGIREAWEPLFNRNPPIVRASYTLTVSTIPTMTVQVLRLSTGGIMASYFSRAEFERGVREAEPKVDLSRFERRAGR